MQKQQLLDMFERIEQMKNPLRRYPNKTIIHYGESSNSLTVFQAASLQLGCRTLTVYSRPESLEDSIQTLHYCGDVMVLNHPHEDAMTRAVAVSKIPVLKDTIHCNMAYALTDLYTLYKELKFRGIHLDRETRPVLHITFLGYSRNVHSFVKLLQLFPRIECHYTQKIAYDPMDPTDVLYVSRRQGTEEYQVNPMFLQKTKPTLILMHPFPRSVELSMEVDKNPRSVYFHQLENSLYVRMAMLDQLLTKTCYPTFWECLCITWFYIANLASIFSRCPVDNSGV